MSNSGTKISNDCIQRFQELKLNKKYKFIIYKLSDDFTTIEVEHASDVNDWDVFRQKLLEAETKSKSGVSGKGPRFAVYDFNYDLSSGEGSRSKIVFISWSPDDAAVQAKMIYASSKEGLRRTLEGIAQEFQANDEDEIEYQSVLKSVSKGLA